ncbi:MAG: 30S ribosomal protein S15 [Candidatus Dependentiae bacterium]
MALDANKKSTIIESFKQSPNDTGSVEVQIALLTEKIKMLTNHFESNPKDFSSKRGLLDAVSRRRKYLRYLEKHNLARYKTTIERLGLRK